MTLGRLCVLPRPPRSRPRSRVLSPASPHLAARVPFFYYVLHFAVIHWPAARGVLGEFTDRPPRRCTRTSPDPGGAYPVFRRPAGLFAPSGSIWYGPWWSSASTHPGKLVLVLVAQPRRVERPPWWPQLPSSPERQADPARSFYDSRTRPAANVRHWPVAAPRGPVLPSSSACGVGRTAHGVARVSFGPLTSLLPHKLALGVRQRQRYLPPAAFGPRRLGRR